MTRTMWETVFLLLNGFGVLIFGQIFWMLLPARPWRDSIFLAMAIMNLALSLFFLWLFVADLAAVFDIAHIEWVSGFPVRGIVLRLILLLPGFWLLTRIGR